LRVRLNSFRLEFPECFQGEEINLLTKRKCRYYFFSQQGKKKDICCLRGEWFTTLSDKKQLANKPLFRNLTSVWLRFRRSFESSSKPVFLSNSVIDEMRPPVKGGGGATPGALSSFGYPNIGLMAAVQLEPKDVFPEFLE